LLCAVIASCAILIGCERTPIISDEQTKQIANLTPLIAAAKAGDVSTVKKLLATGQDPNQTDEKGYTSLQYAASTGKLNLVQVLLNAKADVNARGPRGYTALHAAAVQRDLAVLKALVEAGADIDVQTEDKTTPLIATVSSPYSSSDVALFLIQRGANVDLADADGATALWYATTDKSIEVLQELLKRGANPNVQTRSIGFPGNTPLHMAALNGLNIKLQLLLQYGADSIIRNAKDETPADVVSDKFPEVKRMLETKK
jgi:ankyrin repeat protein